MVVKKKTVLIISLICLLIVVGFLNHQLTKKSMIESSNEYQRYEEDQFASMKDSIEVNTIEATTENLLTDEDIEDVTIIDSRDNLIEGLMTDTDEDIENTIAKEENMRNNNYFIEYRLSRDKLRASLIDRLNEIVNNDKTSEDMRTNAQNEIMQIGQIAEMELSIEGLIKAKGFEDALIFLKDDSARVVVSANELTEQDVMKILEIVKSEANIDPSNITIMKKF